MAEGVAGHRFADPRRLHGRTHGALHEARIEMVPSFDALARIPPAAALGKQPSPAPFLGLKSVAESSCANHGTVKGYCG